MNESRISTCTLRGGLNRTMVMVGCALLSAAFLSGCSHTSKGVAFSTPEEAVEMTVAAMRAGDIESLERFLGSGAQDALSSGDPVADEQAREEFLAEYELRHELTPGREPDSMVLEVGDRDWPMPIPIVKDADGWRFDTEAGLEEMLDRRIGFNELHTIETLRAVADAQAEYYLMNPTGSAQPAYAAKVQSEPGKFDGLSWPDGARDELSPMGEFVAEALAEGYAVDGKGEPYSGYRYRLLAAQGAYASGGAMSYMVDGRLTKGFAIVAYPAKYGNSGVMTFIMNQHGIVFEQDLGKRTAHIASSMSEYDPGPEWMLIE